MSLVNKRVFDAAEDFGRAIFRVYKAAGPGKPVGEFLSFAAAGYETVENFVAAFPDATEEDFAKHMVDVNREGDAIP